MRNLCLKKSRGEDKREGEVAGGLISCKSSPSSSTRPSRSSSSTTGTLNVDTGLEMRSREQIFKPGGRKAGKRRRGGRGLRSIRRIRVTPESNNTFCRLSALREVGSPFGLPSSPTEEAFLCFVSSASMLFDRPNVLLLCSPGLLRDRHVLPLLEEASYDLSLTSSRGPSHLIDANKT